MRKLALLATVAGLLLASCSGHGTPTPLPDTTSQDTTSSVRNTPIDVDADTLAPASTGDFAGFAGGSAYTARVTIRSGAGISDASGPLAPAYTNCNTARGSSYNSIATVNAAPYVVSSGTGQNGMAWSRTASSASVVATSTLQGVSLLDGLITATAVKAQANSAASSGSASSDETGSEFAGLVVAGHAIDVTPAPNTKITLAGLGYVVLNEIVNPQNDVNSSDGSTVTHIGVNMIHVHVTTANTLGIKVGTEIIVGSANSAFTIPPAPYKVSAGAYSLYAEGLAGNVHASSGPWALAPLPCRSPSATNRLTAATTPVGSLGAMVNSVSQNTQTNTTSGHASSNTASLNILNGLITAQALVTTADVNRSDTSFSRSGSLQFASLHVGGTDVSASVSPNTRITLSGLGYAIVNQQSGSRKGSSVTEVVNAVHVYVNTTNSLHLPVGSQVVVGHARAQITGF